MLLLTVGWYSVACMHSQIYICISTYDGTKGDSAQLAGFPAILDRSFINTTSSYIGVEGGRWRGATKWWVTAELCNFQGEMVHKEAPLHSNCHKT